MEAAIKVHPIVDTVCVYADPERFCTVAFIIPILDKLLEFRAQIGLNDITSMDELCKNETLADVILKSIRSMVKDQLERFEIPQEIKVSSTLSSLSNTYPGTCSFYEGWS